MTDLTNQMQAKMIVRLDTLRKQALTQQRFVGEAIQKRPAVDDSLSKIQNHQVMQNHEDGAIVVGFAMGVPGLDGAIDTAIDVGSELYGGRKATHMRPQDTMPLSIKGEADIREQNRQDLATFYELDKKIDFLNSAMSCGNKMAYHCPETDQILPIDGIPSAEHTMTMTAEGTQEFEQEMAFNMTLKPSTIKMAGLGR